MPVPTDIKSPEAPDVPDSTRRALPRRLPIGAEPLSTDSTHLRIWAPAASGLTIVSGDREVARLEPETENPDYFSGIAPLGPGERYAFRIDGRDGRYPDPASRFQPEGPHGPSEIVDPSAFEWTDQEWPGVVLQNQIIYELHVGTFTADGSWRAASHELTHLADLGISVIEVMPVAEFEGRFGWGYDGVDLFAPSHLYGPPDELRRFIDRAHAFGIGVILDVVYNHLGPSGNYLKVFAPGYFSTRYKNEWGEAINFDDDADAVREFFIANAGYWIDEFHFDGLRLDATQQIFDASSENVMTALAARVRERAGARSTILVAENEHQDARLVRSASAGGYGLDALWNDDFHHSAMVALTGRREAYYSDTRGEPQELISAAKYGYLYQGQHYEWQKDRRGTPALDLDPARFVTFLQNHDQIANSARGLRGHQLTSPGRWRAATAMLLLMPGTPMLFQGQEFSASSPFLYFADFSDELNAAVRKGRVEFLAQFPSLAGYLAEASTDDPASAATFERCKLNFGERATHAAEYALHRDLIALRRQRAAFRAQKRGGVDGAVLGPRAFVLRFFTDDYADDRLLIVNLGPDLRQDSFAEPLIAPPAGKEWVVEWSSEDPRYGGGGVARLSSKGRWCLPGECALVLAPGDPTARAWKKRATKA
jgi:maltooligosyltrehalose trehalohydrolase